jgi:hypothetical protein
VLFDLMMRGGPLPERHHHLGRALVDPPQLEFTPEEAVVMREWLADQPDDLVDVEARDTAIELVNRALRLAGVCEECGGPFVVEDEDGDTCCARCGELPDA